MQCQPPVHDARRGHGRSRDHQGQAPAHPTARARTRDLLPTREARLVTGAEVLRQHHRGRAPHPHTDYYAENPGAGAVRRLLKVL